LFELASKRETRDRHFRIDVRSWRRRLKQRLGNLHETRGHEEKYWMNWLCEES